MRRLNKYIIVDLETTGHKPRNGDRIIEIGIAVLEEGSIVNQYTTLINPNIEITPFIENLTGITNSDVQHAPIFEEVASDIQAYFQEGYFVAHNVPFDLGFLNDELDRVGMNTIELPILDTVELSRILLPQASSYKLEHLGKQLALAHDAPHRALSDALVTAQLLNFLLDKLAQKPYELINQLKKLEPKLKSDLSSILEQLTFHSVMSTIDEEQIEIFRGFALKKQSRTKVDQQQELPSFGDMIDQLFDAPSGFEKRINHYEKRAGQYEMATFVYDAFQSKQHAMIEAATGTGKTLAYLIPAIYQAVKNHERVVISTHLTQLQTQLVEKEIPLLEQSLPFLFHTTVMKGKQHYVSLVKFEQSMQSNDLDNYDITLTKAIILVWLTETDTGDFDELSLPSSGAHFAKSVSSEAEGTLDSNSPWSTRSFLLRAKDKAKRANLIITNHAFVCTNLASDTDLLPDFSKLIVDEAHHFEAIASKQFGFRLNYLSIQQLLKTVGSINDGFIHSLASKHDRINNLLSDLQWEDACQATKEELDLLFRSLFQYVNTKKVNQVGVSDIGRYQYILKDESGEQWQVILNITERLRFYFIDLIHILVKIKMFLSQQNYPIDVMETLQHHAAQMQKVIDQLTSYFIQPVKNSEVKWIEIESNGARNAVYLYQEPIDVGSILQSKLFSHLESVVLTSATITMKSSFDIFKKRLGFDSDTLLEKQIESPYVYQDQVQLLVPNDFPIMEYNQTDDFIYAMCEAILSLAQITKGRMLVLFTSYDMLRKSYQLLYEWMDQKDYILIAQGISSGSRTRLKKNFQSFSQAILLGTNSFWEGIDIPGSDLSCVVIARLPFQPPKHPAYQAKALFSEKKGDNSFMSVALPNAVLRFKQGFGRLIRSSTDRGIVFVCDERLLTAKYGKYFIDSIPTIDVHYASTKELLETAEEWL
ncbi:ATP-dependent DNA helicase DinG [Paraliobacillus sp. JSM ZJ581]|uniref:ATP-dependent DNA helicase DinG n=1 Tax=Paraliobacillus sp. JSM ZJ581 TaxID=3342118 RepID=UPI0035A858EA